jgi:hypothetical protein
MVGFSGVGTEVKHLSYTSFYLFRQLGLRILFSHGGVERICVGEMCGGAGGQRVRYDMGMLESVRERGRRRKRLIAS